MADRTKNDTLQRPRRRNYLQQIVAIKDRFLSLVPQEYIYYQLTIHCRKDTLSHTAYKADNVKNVIEVVYKRINESFVHPEQYDQEPHRQFMPYLLAMIEFDDNVLFHAHGLLAVHPLLAESVDHLRVYETLCKFDPRITHSHFDRTILDANDIKAFDEPTNVTKWLAYMLKRNKHDALMPKRPEHLLMFGPEL